MRDSLGTAERTGYGASCKGLPLCKTYPAKVKVLHNKTTFKNHFENSHHQVEWELVNAQVIRSSIRLINAAAKGQVAPLTILLCFYICNFYYPKGLLKTLKGWGYPSVTEDLPIACEVLSLVPSITNKQNSQALSPFYPLMVIGSLGQMLPFWTHFIYIQSRDNEFWHISL